MRRHLLLAAAVAACTVATAQAAPNLVMNGNFAQSSYTSNSEFGAAYGGQGVTGWTGNNGFNLYFFNSTATTVSAASQYPSQPQDLWGTSTFGGTSPTGDNFVGLDGDQSAGIQSEISQMVGGLTAGDQYTLDFTWAATQVQSRTGATTESLVASLGAQSFSTPVVNNPSQGFTGWFNQSFTFTASAASEVLSFFSVGTPQGLPPMAALTDVSLTQNVPEPASLALLGAGLGALGLLARRRSAA
jgi:hypothetical protein